MRRDGSHSITLGYLAPFRERGDEPGIYPRVKPRGHAPLENAKVDVVKGVATQSARLSPCAIGSNVGSSIDIGSAQNLC